jgi:hypothetical protein
MVEPVLDKMVSLIVISSKNRKGIDGYEYVIAWAETQIGQDITSGSELIT